MEDFIICLVKYTAIFYCILYSFSRLLKIKLKAWDLFDIPLFIALSAALYFVTVYIKMLVPLGLLIFSVTFLFLRFRKTFYETVTVGTIALGISIVLMLVSFITGFLTAIPLHFIKIIAVQKVIAQVINSVIQVTGIFLLFKIKRLQSGLSPKITNPTFEIMLHLSVGAIISMMLLYIKNATQSMLEIILIIAALFALLIILWWRKHINYNYNKMVERQDEHLKEETIEEFEATMAEKDLHLTWYNKTFHYLNKAVPNCALLLKIAAEKSGCHEVLAANDAMQSIMDEMNLANEKFRYKNIPLTDEKLIDAPIFQLFTEAERKKFNVSADIATDVKGWFADGKLQKSDIHTLLCYLCDNARISALGLPNAKVRVELGETKNKQPLIRIYDSGEQFDEGVLAKLGLEQITTRAAAGGSGVGLFTVFEILQKYGASFTLDEAPTNFGFTKCIEIAFDGRRSTTVRTRRESVFAACAARKQITVERVETEILRDGTNG